MSTIGGLLAVVTLGDPVQKIAAFGAVGVGLLGLLLLLFGVKIIRLLLTICFTGAGAAVGSLIGQVYAHRVSFHQFPWLAAVGGAVIIGLLGFLLCRLWVMIALGVLLAGIGAGVFLGVSARQEVLNLKGDVQRLLTDCQDWFSAVKSAPAGPTTSRDLWASVRSMRRPDSPEVKAAEEKLRTHGDELAKKAGNILRPRGLGLSLGALGGLVVGLLIGGFAYRLAAILLTSIIGLKLLLAGLVVLVQQHWPQAIKQVRDLGWKAGFGVLGLWLIGVAIQSALARKPRVLPEEPVA